MVEENQILPEYAEQPENENSGQGLIVPKTEVVSERDIFKLAIWVLFAAAIIFVAAATARALSAEEGVKDVWDFTKGFISPIVTLVLGLYFGNKTRALN